MAENYSIYYIYLIFFIHSSVDGHIDCLHILTIVNNVAVNIGLHVSFQISISVLFCFVFSKYIPSSGIVGFYGSSLPTNSDRGSLFSTS